MLVEGKAAQSTRHVSAHMYQASSSSTSTLLASTYALDWTQRGDRSQ